METPDEINHTIFSHLSMFDLARMACTSQQHYALAADKSLWQNLLMKDFYFTEATLKTSYKRHKMASYKDLYTFCFNALLNPIQQETINLLKAKGLTDNHLKGRDWFNSLAHQKALQNLIDKQMMDVQSALIVLDHLTSEQAEGISQGLTRHEVMDFNNALEIEAFLCLKKHSLSGDLLKIGNRKNPNYLKALVYLINKRNMPCRTVIAELSELNSHQLNAIYLYQCTPEEVKRLDAQRLISFSF